MSTEYDIFRSYLVLKLLDFTSYSEILLWFSFQDYISIPMENHSEMHAQQEIPAHDHQASDRLPREYDSLSF